jgi:hypothetical protein
MAQPFARALVERGDGGAGTEPQHMPQPVRLGGIELDGGVGCKPPGNVKTRGDALGQLDLLRPAA